MKTPPEVLVRRQAYYQANKERILANHRAPEYLAKAAAAAREARLLNPEKQRAANRKRRDKVKLEVLTHYGPGGVLGCSWPGCSITDVDCLTLDHVNNDGGWHRKNAPKNRRSGGGGRRFTWRLLNKAFQVAFKRCAEVTNSKRKSFVSEVSMGRLWDKFAEKVQETFSKKPEVTTPLLEPEPQPPMRTWRQELLSDEQRHDLEEVVNLPGYEVLQDLWESAHEGFITYLMQISPEDEKKVLAWHKAIHMADLYRKSVEAQVNAYMRLSEAERQEAADLKRALLGPSPVENTETLNRLLDPMFVPAPAETPRRPKKIVTTPMDTMLGRK